MSDQLTTYDLRDGIATITLDDGKVNALSAEMLGSLNGRLDQAESDEAVVVMTGRERTFSAGFDLRSDDAAQAAGKSRSEFIIESARQSAMDVLLDQRFFTLDARRFAARSATRL